MINNEFWLAKRIAFDSKKSFSAFIFKIAALAVALSVAVMIITLSIMNGFQKEVSKKVFDFWGHIDITHFDSGLRFDVEANPLDKRQEFLAILDSIPEVRHVQAYANKAGIIKANNEIEGIVLKGMDSDFDPSFMNAYIVEGDAITIDTAIRNNDIIISKTTADRLQIKVEDRIEVWFIQDPPRVRRLTVIGIYKTGLEEFDKIFAFMDIKHIQRLNDWEPTDVGGFEVFLHDISDLDQVEEFVYMDVLGPDLYSQTIRDKHAGIFDWLNLQDVNKRIVLMLMLIIATINMITALLILILERTNMIGILKSMGASNWTIRKVFIYYALYILGFGLLLGNTIAIVLLSIQKKTGFITLDEASYYLDRAPVDLSIGPILWINILTILICFVVLIIPSYLITRISPVKAIRFS